VLNVQWPQELRFWLNLLHSKLFFYTAKKKKKKKSYSKINFSAILKIINVSIKIIIGLVIDYY
jgi:hypothetical protein